MMSSTTDVLVVGAGPTGTALAIDLIRRGVSVRLIDKGIESFDGSRAKGIQPRTMEVLEDLGVIERIVAEGSPYPKMGIHLGPLTVPKRMMAAPSKSPTVPYPDVWLIPQNRTIAALHSRCEDLGGRVEPGTELTSYTPSATRVVAEVTGPDGPEEITARFLVGADGGSSRVRKGVGIGFTGSTDDADRMLIVDAAVDGVDLSRSYWHVWPGLRGRFVGACPLPHCDLFQWMIRLSPGEDPPVGVEAISARIRSQTRMSGLRLRSVEWRSVFRPNIRLAETYRRGPVLLAGDAAHVHTPAGAQGMNTGIGDAHNLGWKLAQVIAGGDDTLLDTYEAERRPIAAAVLGLSTEKYQGMGRLDPASLKRGTDEQQLTLTYRGGPLAPTRTSDPSAVTAGDRAPDVALRLADGTPIPLFEILQGPQFTAIALGSSATAALTRLDWPATGAPVRRVAVVARSLAGDDAHESIETVTDPSDRFADTYRLVDDAIVLIRPDGYIGAIITGDLVAATAAAALTLTAMGVGHSSRGPMN
ncbi:FAD-dependent monooxygenase [Williamsia herbipolensis]|uniref:FAD-dependent monooxygenase n=1 Tax=Williamsia herbipolensis TaxID=1603258 RepID=UPI0005F85473|nr:FAD-dependent monooxygenase [Williamsia herbipolensis]